MTGARLDALISRGYAEAASKVGTLHSQYRPRTNGAVFQNSNLVTPAFPLSITVDKGFERPRKYNEFVEYALFDPSQVEPGDYFTNGKRHYFVPTVQTFVPNLMVYCNLMVSIVRGNIGGSAGYVGYSGTESGNESVSYGAWPVSLMLRPRRSRNPIDLPTDMPNGEVQILMPYFPQFNRLEIGDYVVDMNNIRYAIQYAELSDLGWRALANVTVV